MKQTILKTDQLSKIYISGDRTLAVLQDISFDIRQGATCAIVGPSGSGKTTLLGLCAGLDRPTAGKVFLVQNELNSLSEEELAKLRNDVLGFVFQSFQLIPTLTALENVMVPAELKGENDVKDRAVDLMEKVGLGDRIDHYPTQLSGGEQQRVALARAFVNRPQVLFADEPTGNLDTETSETVERLLFDLNRENGTTLILVTHNIELAEKTERIIALKSGKIAADSATSAEERTL